ncbi:MAG: hypothetical protein ACK5JT_19660, partial [Hyphomicrobiaceae bacterium]
LMGRVETSMAPLFPAYASMERQRSARVLWAGVHVITSLAPDNKVSNVTSEAASLLVRDLNRNYLAGIAACGGKDPS